MQRGRQEEFIIDSDNCERWFHVKSCSSFNEAELPVEMADYEPFTCEIRSIKKTKQLDATGEAVIRCQFECGALNIFYLPRLSFIRNVLFKNFHIHVFGVLYSI